MEREEGEGGQIVLVFAYKNQHIFGARTICTSKSEREREGRSTWASALHCNCRRSAEREGRGEGGGGRKANNLIKTSIKNCKNTTTQAAVKMFMQN